MPIMVKTLNCPNCGCAVEKFKNPFPTVDIIIEVKEGIVLISRKNPPIGWAIPGGFIDYGEAAETAAVREAEEETSLKVTDLRLLGVYSAPERDPRMHTISVTFTAKAAGAPKAKDDAIDARVFNRETLPSPLCFDHAQILRDYFIRKERGEV